MKKLENMQLKHVKQAHLDKKCGKEIWYTDARHGEYKQTHIV